MDARYSVTMRECDRAYVDHTPSEKYPSGYIVKMNPKGKLKYDHLPEEQENELAPHSKKARTSTA